MVESKSSSVSIVAIVSLVMNFEQMILENRYFASHLLRVLVRLDKTEKLFLNVRVTVVSSAHDRINIYNFRLFFS